MSWISRIEDDGDRVHHALASTNWRCIAFASLALLSGTLALKIESTPLDRYTSIADYDADHLVQGIATVVAIVLTGFALISGSRWAANARAAKELGVTFYPRRERPS